MSSASRTRGLAHGGIGAIHALARQIGLIDAIDERLHLLKIHLPFHESDHVLNFAYNPLCEGTCLHDIELRRNDEVFLDALGCSAAFPIRLPPATSAGRLSPPTDIDTLQDIFNDVRQPRTLATANRRQLFSTMALIDMDGSLVETTGQCKQGMDIAYDGTWGYHPLVLTLAATGEVLSIVNRSGNRPSHEGAAAAVDRVVAVCREAGFRKVLLRGDTDFSQSEHLDRWTAAGNSFIFGFDAAPNLKTIAEALPAAAWLPLPRLANHIVQDAAAAYDPDNVKEAIVVEREYEKQRLCAEEVAEFYYRPTACGQAYRMIVVRKNISVSKGEQCLFDEVRYFFYITNVTLLEPKELVWVCSTIAATRRTCWRNCTAA